MKLARRDVKNGSVSLRKLQTVLANESLSLRTEERIEETYLNLSFHDAMGTIEEVTCDELGSPGDPLPRHFEDRAGEFVLLIRPIGCEHLDEPIGKCECESIKMVCVIGLSGRRRTDYGPSSIVTSAARVAEMAEVSAISARREADEMRKDRDRYRDENDALRRENNRLREGEKKEPSKIPGQVMDLINGAVGAGIDAASKRSEAQRDVAVMSMWFGSNPLAENMLRDAPHAAAAWMRLIQNFGAPPPQGVYVETEVVEAPPASDDDDDEEEEEEETESKGAE